MAELRVISPDNWREWRAVRLAALEDAPYAFGATLAEWQGEGDNESRWRGRLTDIPFNVVASVDGRDVGQASGIAPDELDHAQLISFWVAPAARRRGVGRALVMAVATWARERGASVLRLHVRRDNDGAIAFYRRVGFTDTDDESLASDDPREKTMLLPLGGSPSGPS